MQEEQIEKQEEGEGKGKSEIKAKWFGRQKHKCDQKNNENLKRGKDNELKEVFEDKVDIIP